MATKYLIPICTAMVLSTGPALGDAGKAGHAGHMMGNRQAHHALSIEGAWARATPPRARNGAGYLTVVNHASTADRLIAAASPVADRAELHTHAMESGVMKMRPIPHIDVPPGGRAEIKPGGDHIMLLGLKSPLRAGTSIHVTLTFEKAGIIRVELPILKRAPKGTDHGHGTHNHGKSN